MYNRYSPEHRGMMAAPVVFISSWGKNVSFTGVLHHVVFALGQRQIYVLALDQLGDVHVEGNVTIIPAHCEGYEIHKAQLVFDAVRRIKPAAVFFYYDLFAAQYHYQVLLEIQRSFAPVIIYLPIDGTLCNIHPLWTVTGFERVVFFTETAKKRFLNLAADIQNAVEQELLIAKCHVIAHGVDRTHFFPTKAGALVAKRNAFPNHPELSDSPIILNGNRPWERKRLDLTLEGFSRFLKESRRKVYLYLHLPGANDEDVMQIECKVNELGIRQNVLMQNVKWTTVKGLNWIYNACEIGINTAMGEGWGLVSCEHGATGAAQIVPDDAQQHDIWGSSALYAKTSGTERSWACPHVFYQVVDADSVAQSLSTLLSDDKYLNERSQAAATKMNDSRFDWKVIEYQWVRLFDEVFESCSNLKAG